MELQDIQSRIYNIRGMRVILDRDLAELYGVETRVLKQAVRRNLKRFPKDFMFQLSIQEFSNWRSHNVTSNSTKMGLRYAPFAFTEQGVARRDDRAANREQGKARREPLNFIHPTLPAYVIPLLVREGMRVS